MNGAAPVPGRLFGFQPDEDAPGWYVSGAPATGLFIDIFGQIRMRAENARIARVRFTPERSHRNLLGAVHGGFIMAVVDQVLFLGPMALGVERAMGGVTVDASTQFFAPLRVEAPFDAVVELLRETGRMLFLRGLIEQGGEPAVAFSGTVRKASAPLR